MKPRHIGYLLAGAALAGGLAVTMTQAPPIPALAPAASPAASPATQPERPQVTAPEVSTAVRVAKPSPIPSARPQVLPQQSTSAPQPVYDEPAKPAIRKNKPISMARMTTTRPTQWTPGPYTGPAIAAKPATQVTPILPSDPVATPTPPSPRSAPRRVILQTGMAIPIRLDESLSSDRTVAGSMFEGSLVEPFVVEGLVIAERGALVTGRIVSSENARVELGLATLATSDGQNVAISTDPWTKLIGSGDALGAGTVIRFRLASRVTITERKIGGQ
jgi:hypothetical protein